TFEKYMHILRVMKTYKTIKNSLPAWLKVNGPATAELIAAHLLGVGAANLSQTNTALRALKAQGVVEPVSDHERPFRWQLKQMPQRSYKVVVFPKASERLSKMAA